MDDIKRKPRLAKEKSTRPLPFAMNMEQQKAIVSFAERRSTLSSARAEELAEIIAPILTDKETSPVQQLQQIANGILGRS